MSGKYSPLEKYLRNLPESKRVVTLRFGQIEEILNDKLPPSACQDRSWWKNYKGGKHVNTYAWSNAGWKVDEVNLNEKWVVLVRAEGESL
jgi:hypothetical protein